MYSESQKKFGTKTQCKIFHDGTLRGGHLNSENPWDSITQRVWVYPEIFNINFLPQFFVPDFPTHIETPKKLFVTLGHF